MRVTRIGFKPGSATFSNRYLAILKIQQAPEMPPCDFYPLFSLKFE